VNCREAERLIDTFYDGELDGRSMRDAAMHITRCKRCESELNEREGIQKLLSSAVESEIAGIDMSRIWAAVEPTLERGQRRGLSVFRRLGWLGEEPRVAATSTSLGGVLLGRKQKAGEDDLDPAEWAAPEPRRGRTWQWSLAGGAALAASVLLAVALLPGGSRGPSSTSRVEAGHEIERPAAVAEVARTQSAPPQAVAEGAPIVEASVAPFDLASESMRPHGANKQVQVESVNFPRSSVAMWSEPASDTTVIWIEDEEQAASGRR
jgi:hypothetical protein